MTEKSLRQKYKHLSEAYAHAITSLNELEDQRDTLKKVAKEVLFVLEKAGLYPELQEQLQLAIGNLPKEAAKQNPAAEDPPPNENKGG